MPPPSPEPLLAALRQATSERHARIEALLRLEAPMPLARYRAILRGFHEFLACWEAAVRAALPELRRAQGHVVNIASTAAFRGWPNASAYHASKWGLRGLGQGLFTELREHGIRLTTVFAGGMRTPFILDRFPDTPLDVLQDPRTVALAIRAVLDLPPESVVPEITVLPMRETSWP